MQATISTMELNGETCALREHVILEVGEYDFCGIKVLAASHETFGVMSLGNTDEEVISRASDHLVSMYNTYTSTPDRDLHKNAVIIKNRLKTLI